MNRYFYCYSYPLKEFFKSSGLQFVTASVNLKTNKRYWVFEGTDELNELLAVWRSRRRMK